MLYNINPNVPYGIFNQSVAFREGISSVDVKVIHTLLIPEKCL